MRDDKVTEVYYKDVLLYVLTRNETMISKQYIRVKIIVIGDAGVGKTSLVRQYVNKTSPGSNNNDKTRCPRVCDINEMTFMWEHDVIKFSILDTAG